MASENAVGGALAAGDRVDVIDVVDGAARYVVTGALVTRVPSSETAAGIARGAARDFYVVVQVDDAGALALAEAAADGKLDVVRSSGAAPPRPQAPAPVPAEPEGAQAPDGEDAERTAPTQPDRAATTQRRGARP